MWIGEDDERPKITHRSRTVRRPIVWLGRYSCTCACSRTHYCYRKILQEYYPVLSCSPLYWEASSHRPPWGQVTSQQRTSPSFCRFNRVCAGEQHSNFTASYLYSLNLSLCDSWLNSHTVGSAKEFCDWLIR